MITWSWIGRKCALRSAVVTLTGAVVLAGALNGTASVASTASVNSTAPALAPLRGSAATTASGTASADVVPDSYIVVLKEPAENTPAGAQAATAKAPAARAAAARAAAARARSAGGIVSHTYTRAVQGYSATLSSTQLTTVRQDPAVKYVQRNLRFHGSGATQSGPDNWALDRIDQRNLPLRKDYYYSATGASLYAYVMDTGISAVHPDFRERVSPGMDAIGSTDGTRDCNGHGTSVAGALGGQVYGVAKRVLMSPVRVLDCAAIGTSASVVAGLDWIAQELDQRSILNDVHGLSLVNMSLGGPPDQVVDDAVQATIDAGTTVVVAAGNGPNGKGQDACNVSPARVPDAITVAASTSADRAAPYSNYGPCVDLYAPGDKIRTTFPGKNDGQFWIGVESGTSMAAPLVTGTLALHIERKARSTLPRLVADRLMAAATKNKITGVNPKFPHSLLFSLQPVPLPTNAEAGINGTDRLQSSQSLLRGTRLYSRNKRYFMANRARDGWLCLYDSRSGKVLWTNGHAGAWTNMNTSGSLATYDSYGRRTWSSNTPDGEGTFSVNPDGYLRIKRDSDGKITWTTPH